MNEPAQETLLDARKESSGGATPRDFREIVSQYQTPLLRYVGQFLGRGPGLGPEAEDIVQETFLRFYRQMTRDGEASVRETGPWLFRVAHNLSLDAIRRRGRSKEMKAETAEPKAASSPDALAAMVQREACDLALAELNRLPDEQKQVILLRVIQGMKLREISEATGLTIGNAGYRITQGLNELARRLKAAGVVG